MLFTLENEFALFCILQRIASLTENVLCSCSLFQKFQIDLFHFAFYIVFSPLQKISNRLVSLCILHCIFSPTGKCLKSVYIACYPAFFFPQKVCLIYLWHTFLSLCLICSLRRFLQTGKAQLPFSQRSFSQLL